MDYTVSHTLLSDRSLSSALRLPSVSEVMVAAACVGVITISNVENIHAVLGAYPIASVVWLLGTVLLGLTVVLAANKRLPSARTSLLIACGGAIAALMHMVSSHALHAYGSYNTSRLLVVVLFAAAAVLVVGFPGMRRRWLRIYFAIPAIARYALAIVVGLGTCSALLSASPIHSLAEISQYVLLFVLAGLVAAAVLASPVTFRNVALACVTVTAVLYLISFFASWGYHLAGDRMLVWPDINLGFSNIRFFNQLQTWTLPLLILPALMLQDKHRLLRWGFVAMTAVWWALLISSGGRGTTAGVLFGAAVVATLFGRKAWSWLRLQVAALLGGAAIYGLLYRPFVTASLFDRNPISSGARPAYWEHAWDLTMSSPLVGVGPMHYAQLLSDSVGGHPHNAFLQFAAEWGLPVAIVVTLLGVWAFYAWSKKARAQIQFSDDHSRSLVMLGLTATIAAAAAHSMVSGITVTPLSQLFMALILGWAWGLYLQSAPDRQHPPVNRVQHAMLIAIAAISVAVLLFFVIGELPHLQESAATYSELGHDTRFHPRFWQQGFINILK